MNSINLACLPNLSAPCDESTRWYTTTLPKLCYSSVCSPNFHPTMLCCFPPYFYCQTSI